MQLQELPVTPGYLPPAEAKFLAADAQMLRVRELAERVAPTASPVLIVGETGTGKDILARFIHAASGRHGDPFLKISCAAMPHDLLESELFGHEGVEGTDGDTGRPHRAGKLELARQGTLLIDDIGEMSPALQARLLQVLEDGTFRRVGGTQTVASAARIIATAGKALEGAVAQGEFRKDLFYRLKAVRFNLPTLRERRADIAVLCQHFLRGSQALPERVTRAFAAYGWPGNVRELKHLVERYAILPDADMVLEELAAGEHEAESETLRERLAPRLERQVLAPGKVSIKPLAARAAEEAERKIVLAVLEETHWNRRRAAARLDICYKTLLNKLNQWELSGKPRRAPRPATGAAGGRTGLGLIPQVAGALAE